MGAGVGYPKASDAAKQYKAFISYSHVDEAPADRLHNTLEAFRIHKALWGLPTHVGPVPKTLHPIFRDRRDLPAGASLPKKLQDALSSSQFLIVVCSPASATSDYVNEEIQYFQRLGRGEQILTLIVDGVPSDTTRDCFPPALLQSLNEGNDTATKLEEPLAADARVGKDGREIAHLKLIAGLLGLPLDIIVQREELRRRKERLLRSATVAAFIAASIVSVLSAQQAFHSSRNAEARLHGAIELAADSRGLVSRLTDSMRMRVSEATDILTDNTKRLGDTKLYDLNDPGVRIERAKLQLRLARDYGRQLKTIRQFHAANQALAEIADLSVQGELTEAILMLRADAHWLRGNTFYAEANFEAAWEEYDRGEQIIQEALARFFREHDVSMSKLGPEHYIVRARLILGKAGSLARRERQEEALDEVNRSIVLGRGLPLDSNEVAQILVQAHYLAADLRRQLDAQQRTGRGHGAREVEAALSEDIERELRRQNDRPERDWGRGVGNLYLERGDVLRQQGKHKEALGDYENAKSLRGTLTKADPSDIVLKDEFAFSLIKVGEQLNALRRRNLLARDAEAVNTFDTAEHLFSELHKERPDDVRFRHWRWTAHQGLAEAYRLSNSSAQEMIYNARKLQIAGSNFLHTQNIEFRLDLAESYRDFGEALVSRKEVHCGLEQLSNARELLEPLIGSPKATLRSLSLQTGILKSIARASAIRQDVADMP